MAPFPDPGVPGRGSLPAAWQDGGAAGGALDGAPDRLNRYQRWQLAVSVGGWLIALSALVTLAVQMHGLSRQEGLQAEALRLQLAQSEQLTRTLQVQTFQALSQTWAQIDAVFIARPHLRPYFFDGQVLPRSDNRYPEALSVADLVLDLFEAYRNSEHALMKAFPTSQTEYSAANANYIVSTFAHSPLLCGRLADAAALYTSRLKEMAQRPCAGPTAARP